METQAPACSHPGLIRGRYGRKRDVLAPDVLGVLTPVRSNRRAPHTFSPKH
jgi:hypothetical protein